MPYNLILTGLPAEMTGKRKISLNTGGITTLAQLEKELRKKIPALGRYVLKISVNGKLQADDIDISDKDEFLVFSAYSGG